MHDPGRAPIRHKDDFVGLARAGCERLDTLSKVRDRSSRFWWNRKAIRNVGMMYDSITAWPPSAALARQ